MSMSYSKKTMIWSLCAALCIVLPQSLRVIPNADAAFMAMQLPVIMCGILCGSGGGLMCAVSGCCVSALLCGVPVVPMFPVSLLELSLMGLVSGFVKKFFSAADGEKAVVFSVISAMLTGRIAAGALAAMLFSPGREAATLWVWGYFVAGLPAFIVQLVLVPTIFRALEYSGLIKLSDNKNIKAAPAEITDDKSDEGAENSEADREVPEETENSENDHEAVQKTENSEDDREVPEETENSEDDGEVAQETENSADSSQKTEE